MKIIKFIAFSCLVSSFSFSSSFGKTTLDDLKSYSSSYQEYPKMDNKDLLNPDYTTFYKRMIPGVLDNFLYFLHLKRKPFWSIEKFNALVDALIAKQKEGNFIYKFTPKPETKFIIWGDLQGAYHSLVRDIVKLKELNIIDNDLKIIKPDHYFVFNGNLINNSPYILEVLYLVMELMEKNPGHVFYIRGKEENANHWYGGSIKREFDIKTQLLPEEERSSLIEKLGKFFNLLPLALFLKLQRSDEYICISYLGLEEDQLKESSLADLLKKEDEGKPLKLNLDDATSSKDFVNVEAIIKRLDLRVDYLPTKGLIQLPPDHGASAWTVFSSPIMRNQKAYGFFYDAFAVLTVGADIYKWTISLYSQDARKKEGFNEKSYYLVSGQSTSLPSSSGAIVVGCSLDLSTDFVEMGEGVIQALFMSVNNQNKKGGINDKYIKLVFLNDNYDPILAKKNIETFLSRYKTDIILSSPGSPTLEGYISIVKSGKVLVLFPLTGAPNFRKPDLPMIVHLMASYFTEGQVLVQYAIKKLSARRIAIVYQNDSFGKGALAGARSVFSKNKFKSFIEIPYSQKSFSFKDGIEKILSYKPDAIIFFSTAMAAIAFIRQIDAKNLIGKHILGISDLAESTFKNFIEEKGLKPIITQSYPNVKTSDLEIIKEYREDTKRQGASIDPIPLQAYVGGSLLVDILKKIEGEVTKEKIMEKIEALQDYDFKGLKLNFDPQTRELRNDVWIDTGASNWEHWEMDKS